MFENEGFRDICRRYGNALFHDAEAHVLSLAAMRPAFIPQRTLKRNTFFQKHHIDKGIFTLLKKDSLGHQRYHATCKPAEIQ